MDANYAATKTEDLERELRSIQRELGRRADTSAGVWDEDMDLAPPTGLPNPDLTTTFNLLPVNHVFHVLSDGHQKDAARWIKTSWSRAVRKGATTMQDTVHELAAQTQVWPVGPYVAPSERPSDEHSRAEASAALCNLVGNLVPDDADSLVDALVAVLTGDVGSGGRGVDARDLAAYVTGGYYLARPR